MHTMTTPYPTLDGAPMSPDLAAHILACNARYRAANGCRPCGSGPLYARDPHARHCPRYVDPRVPAMVAELVAIETAREALS